VGVFFYSEQKAKRAIARFLVDLTTGVAGSEEKSFEKLS